MKNKKMDTGKVAIIGLSVSLALLLSYVELLLPPIFVAVPGIKMGLPNVVILYTLYVLGVKYAILVSGVRLVISSILFGNPMTFLYSLAGATLSLLVMILLKKTDKLSSVGVSVAGAVCHNIGQVLMAMLLLGTNQIAYYLVVLLITGTVAGIFIGLVGGQMVSRLSLQKMLKK